MTADETTALDDADTVPSITELIDELREHVSGRVAFCQICDGALTVHREFTPDSDYSIERDDVYVTGPCVDQPDHRHEQREDEIIAYADGQMLERSVLEYGVLRLCAEVERLRAWLESIEAVTEAQNGPRCPGLWLLDAAWESARKALAGEAVPE